MINTLCLRALCNFQSLISCTVSLDQLGTWDWKVEPGLEPRKGNWKEGNQIQCDSEFPETKGPGEGKGK